MSIPIVPAPDTGPATNLTNQDIANIVGTVTTNTDSILGVANPSDHSLNALVELVYVRVGNEVMAQALSKLEGALNATKSTLDALSTVQGLQNQISIKGRSGIPFTFNTTYQVITYTSKVGTGTQVSVYSKTLNDTDSYMSGYLIVASSYYKPIDPYFSVSIPGQISAIDITASTAGTMTARMQSGYNYFRSSILSSKRVISGLIAQLSAITPRVNGQEDPTSLLAKLRTVYGHLPQDNFASMRAWILDGYTAHNSSDVTKQGAFQQEITNAIVAGESLNSSQNASVRRYMFIFEQYYQSASSIISQLNQIMSNIARKVSG